MLCFGAAVCWDEGAAAELPNRRLVSAGSTLGPASKRGPHSELVVLGWGATEANTLSGWLLEATVGAACTHCLAIAAMKL